MTQETGTGHRPIQPLTTIQAASETTPPDPGHYSEIYVPRAAAGVVVTQETALTFAAVFAAIRAISEDIAGLGHRTRRQMENGTREDIPEHPANRLFAYPNQEMSGYTLREVMEAHALSWGNGYAEIEFNARRRPVALYLLTPDRVTPRRIDGEIVYQVRNAAGKADTYLPAHKVMHLHGLGYDGLGGYSVVNMAARTIGMGIAGDEYGAATYNNRATPSGLLKHPNKLDADGRTNLRESWEGLYRGPKNAARVAILEEGMDFMAIGLPPSDVQFLENRQFQIEEIARWYRIPPHKLAHIVKSTFNNIEEQNINYVQDALLPWVNRWESEVERKLLAPTERGRVRFKLNLNTLLRGAIEKRYTSYATGRQWGWLSPNDVRTLEDMDPLPPEQGDSYITPMNMTPTELLGEEPAPPPSPDPDPDDPDDGAPGAHMRPVIVDAITRCLAREKSHAKRAPKHLITPQEFNGWAARFYKSHADYCASALRPGCVAALIQATGRAPAALDTILAAFVDDMIEISRAGILSAWEAGILVDWSVELQAGELTDRLSEHLADLISLSAPRRQRA